MSSSRTRFSLSPINVPETLETSHVGVNELSSLHDFPVVGCAWSLWWREGGPMNLPPICFLSYPVFPQGLRSNVTLSVRDQRNSSIQTPLEKANHSTKGWLGSERQDLAFPFAVVTRAVWMHSGQHIVLLLGTRQHAHPVLLPRSEGGKVHQKGTILPRAPTGPGDSAQGFVQGYVSFYPSRP